MYKIYTSLILILLSGCVTNGTSTLTNNDTPEHIITSTHKMFVGVPVLLSFEGSYVGIGSGWAITAAHNKPILSLTRDDVIYHPTCDIALFKVESEMNINLGRVFSHQESIYAAGYPIGTPLVYNKGLWIGDVVSQDRPECLQSLGTFNTTGGMSGGGIWNSKGELIGVVVGVLDKATFQDGSVYKNISIWQSVNGVQDWIFEHTGIRVE